MLFRSAFVLLIVAFASACLVQHVQAKQIPVRRSLSTDASMSSAAGKLNRRWWFGFTGSLGKEPDNGQVQIKIIPDALIIKNPPANKDDLNKLIENLKRKHPRFKTVVMPTDPNGDVVIWE
ncbi:cysteine-protease inhibitor [Mycosarcoma maydis]|uniref:Secreted effector PIT2 n=1 Tax=Mycosarcoma maydis TaxID=5270 RepID=PIT2_MYCMD|nr:cysteine-protease inhibitor [Ustilago maydis 521]A0A0D1EAR7.1 RecName: Full=Secreted effector PIT2; AltName: Full=Proteins important for tumors 2; Flags: Precursor [Ustilago maydis 521]KIS71480.1 cysteine-protease inhibitor [Ustilago maydis 521]|eukprot:XP_011387264.1 cysteine-protease inhibitor [Ustilago maydis 521]